MVDFVGRTTSTVDEAARWGTYFGGVEDRAQTRYANREARRRYDEANRLNRDIAISDQGALQQNAGLVTGMGSELAGLQPINPGIVPPNGQATASAAPATGPVNLRPPNTTPPAATPATHVPATEANPRQLASTQHPGPAEGTPTATPNENWVPARESDLTPEQLRAHQDYIRANYGGVGSSARRASTQRRITELGLAYDQSGRLLRRATEENTPGAAIGAAAGRHGAGLDVPTADVGADLQTGVDTASSAAADMLSDPHMQYAAEDTSRPLQPTYEMQLISTMVQDNMRRAQIYSQHGANAQSQQAFGMVLQGLAANRQQENLVLLRAAADGSERAASALIARFHGYPPGTVEIHPTDASRQHFVLQVRGEDGQMRMATNGAPMTRTDLISRLQTLADAETARANAEVSAENERNIRDNQTRYSIASLEVQGRMFDTMSEAETARARMIMDQMIAQGGRPQLATTENGGLILVSPVMGEDGQMTQNIQWIREEQQQTPNVDGRGSERRPAMVSSRVTGTTNVGAH